MTPEQEANIIDLITRYEGQLKLPFIPTSYYPDQENYHNSLKTKIKELKEKLNGTDSFKRS